MTVILELEPEIEMTAVKQAEAEGLPLEKYVESVVKEAIFKRERCRNDRKNPLMKFSNRSETKLKKAKQAKLN